MGRGPRLLDACEWYKVYDIAETIWRSLEYRDVEQELFEGELNRLFREKGIGWELKNPLGIVFRGDANFTNATEKAAIVFQETGRETAAAEIREADSISSLCQPTSDAWPTSSISLSSIAN